MTPRLDAIGLVAGDLARSLDFYRRLGVDIAEPEDGSTHVEAVLPNGLRLMWDTVEGMQSFDPGFEPGTDGASLAFGCADPAEVDAVHADLVAAGFDGHRRPWDAPWGQRYASLRDPDGNGVDLFAPL